ncbi:MAG: alpha/beta hydrolase [Marinibacterium sp.]|nr:alpha/beta hydrolase [Marinibacterium sp.]
MPGTISPEAAEALRTMPEVAVVDGDVRAVFDALEAAGVEDNAAALRAMPSRVEEVEIGGRTHLLITPETADPARAGKLMVHVHGGAHTYSTPRSTLVASLRVAQATGAQVLSVHYPLAWEAPFPASRDFVMQVYAHLLKDYAPGDLILTGDSAGGGLILSTLQALLEDGQPMPAAAALLSPWVDISDAGDTNITLRRADPIIVYDDNLAPSARIYAGDLDLSDPGPSPIYGPFSADLPPMLVTTGTRDLFLSGAARLQRRLLDAGVPVDLIVYEGMWHVFQIDDLPESDAAWRDYSRFVDRVWPR